MSRRSISCPSCRSQDLAVKRHTGVIVPEEGVWAKRAASKPNTILLMCPACHKVAEWPGKLIVIQPV